MSLALSPRERSFTFASCRSPNRSHRVSTWARSHPGRKGAYADAAWRTVQSGTRNGLSKATPTCPIGGIAILPPSGRTRPRIARSVVVFPEPLTPTKPVTYPRGTPVSRGPSVNEPRRLTRAAVSIARSAVLIGSTPLPRAHRGRTVRADRCRAPGARPGRDRPAPARPPLPAQPPDRSRRQTTPCLAR